MKKYIILSILAIFAVITASTLSSCKKEASERTADITPNSNAEFYDGDDYDKGVVVEEPEEAEDIDDDVYQTETGTKVVSLTSDKASENEHGNEAGCSHLTYKYKDSYPVGDLNNQSIFNLTLSQTDSITEITSNRSGLMIGNIMRGTPTFTQFETYWNKDDSIKTKSIKFNFVLNSGKTISKTVKTVGLNKNSNCYGTSTWGAAKERATLNKSSNLSAFTMTNITSAYTPQKGDVLQYGTEATKLGVITTTPNLRAATNTKPASQKFKVVEMNAKCTNRKTTKSITMTDPTQIKSADGVTFATKFFRD